MARPIQLTQLDQYFRVIASREEYLGRRYFKYNKQYGTCVQICMTVGDGGRGRANVYGIYTISKLTFFSNYLSMNYVEHCSKKEFDKKFEETIKALK